MAEDGLVTLPSAFSVKQTIDRLEADLRNRGATIFARIDHAAGASQVGLPLRPTELLIFGNARGGTPLMQMRQTIGIDLPLKALAWEDQTGRIWITYNDPAWLAARHGLGPESANTTDALGAMLKAATPRPGQRRKEYQAPAKRAGASLVGRAMAYALRSRSFDGEALRKSCRQLRPCMPDAARSGEPGAQSRSRSLSIVESAR